MEKMKVVFTGGGTGGHVYPNVAIYEKIKEEFPESTFLYIGTKDGAENRIVKNLSQPIEFKEVLSKGIPQNIRSFKTIIALFYIFLGTIRSYFILRKFKPDIIIGSGGYVAAPVLFAASLLKLKVFIHEQNAVPGRLNRFIARFATKIGVSFSSTANFFPEEKVIVTGYPLRKSIRFGKDDNIKKKYKIPEKNRVVFIFGGSRGAKSINNSIAELIPMLLAMKDITVILSTGRGYSSDYKAFDDTIKKIDEIGILPEVEGKLIVKEYFDNIDEIYSISDLIISRAGAGTIKEITTLGIPSILIPKINLPGDHQILNAREVEKIGGARIVYESVKYVDNKQAIYVPEDVLLDVIKKTLLDSDVLFKMRKNLHQIEKQNSTDLIMEVLLQILRGKVKSDEEQIKVYYLQSQNSEKNIELIFDSTIIGNSYLCDYYLESEEEDLLFRLKIIDNNERIICQRLKGKVVIDGQYISKWRELKEENKLKIAGKTYVLKSYLEKVKKIFTERSPLPHRLRTFFGIMVSRLGGLFRQIFVGAYFGAAKASDIYIIGLTLANFMRRMLAGPALENAFLPIFTRLFNRTSKKKTWEAASSITNFTLFLACVFTLTGVIFAPTIIKILFPSFVKRGIAIEAIHMTKLIFPFLFLITLIAVMTTYLKALKRFGIAEFSVLLFSLGAILGIVLFSPVYGLYSIGHGILLGGILQILFLLPFLLKLFKNKILEFSYKPVINFTNPYNKKYYYNLGPISLDALPGRINYMVTLILGSRLVSGSITFLHFSLVVISIPFAVISQAVNRLVLKGFSEKVAFFDKKKTKGLFLDGLKTNIFLLIPMSILIIVLARPIVSIIFERGSFDVSMVTNTSIALQFYGIGLVGWGIHSLTLRIFSTRLDLKTSTLINFFMVCVNILLSIYLVRAPFIFLQSIPFAGLALASSVSYILFSFVRIAVLRSRLGKEEILIGSKSLLAALFKTLLASLFMVIVLIQARFIFNEIEFSSKLVGNLFLIVSLSFVGISIYLLTSLMLKNTELLIFKKKLLRKKPGVPLSMLSPFKFLAAVSSEPDSYRDDYLYKINIYISNRRWEIRNVGVKLIGLFKDKSKTDFLIDIIKLKRENGFMRRNSIHSLKQLNVWNSEIKKLLLEQLNDSYYEIRVAAIGFLTYASTPNDYPSYNRIIRLMLKKAFVEEKLGLLRLIAKIGDVKAIDYLNGLFLCSNSLIREELLQLFYSYYRRKLLNADEVERYINKILVTSNNLSPEFKLKSIIKRIYKEIE
jgi:UDP-N-acetylglucosamine--N-acetylmuramyl-(pentapeptide) pyrophosphoryl-undecaprenol N-acetylglucosamine transferase